MNPATGSERLGLVFEQVEKRYGALTALRRVSLEIQPGEFVALLGPNGAGKTTLLRVAALLVRPNAGSVKMTGSAADSPELFKSRVGMVAHSTLLYDELTAEENLHFFARLYGVANVASRAANLLAAAGLTERASSLVRTFSRGMRQRLAIVRALVHSPRILFLDEPSSGLDPQGRVWFAETLAALQRDGCTILASTHARDEVLRLATRAVRLEAGRVVSDSGSGGNLELILASLQAATQ
ncbi:MAG TPA: ABC transporter ATP-binding protein [Candidatus Acidoferrales bacterium]|nr:ABC transporter ATP-binding protein [Candidatus Acidoferrales bacterium]